MKPVKVACGWRAEVAALACCLSLLAAPAFAADTTEEWDIGFTDWECYFSYDGRTAEKLYDFVIGAGTGIGETLSIGLVGGLDHNDTEARVLTSLGIFIFYRFPSISENYGVDFDIMGGFAWEETETELELPIAGRVVPAAALDTEDVYVWDLGVEVSYPTRYVTPYTRAFLVDSFADDLLTGDFTIATLFTLIQERMELLIEWGIEKPEDVDALHSIGLGLNTRFWLWETAGNMHDVELVPEVRYFFENDETGEGFWAFTVGLILTW